MIFKVFPQKRVPSDGHSLVGVWVKIGSNGVAAKIKSHLQGVWCLRGHLRRNLSQGNSNFQIQEILRDMKESQGAGEGELKSGKTGERPGGNFQRWKGGMLKGSPTGRRHSLSGHTSPIKMPRDTGGQCAWPSTLLGLLEEAPLRRCDLLPPDTL